MSNYAPVSIQDNDIGGHGQQQHDLAMRENLVGPSANEPLRMATSVPMIQVVAPATLPEGYEFEATIGRAPNNNNNNAGGVSKIKVKVPLGGIEEGQTFSVPFPTHLDSMISGIHVPVGHWRDGLFDIFRYGLCHPHCWTSVCCALLAAGQVISRLKLSWYGRPGSVAQSTIAFKIIFASVVLYASIYFSLVPILMYLDPNSASMPGDPYLAPPTSYYTIAYLRTMMHWIYLILLTVVLLNVRRTVRTKYAIPTGCEWEDCCCSFWCPCFVAAQLLRHTTDYDVYPATCCTERGIPPTAPSIV